MIAKVNWLHLKRKQNKIALSKEIIYAAKKFDIREGFIKRYLLYWELLASAKKPQQGIQEFMEEAKKILELKEKINFVAPHTNLDG